MTLDFGLRPALRLVLEAMGYMVADAHLGARHMHSHARKPASTQRACGAWDSSNVFSHVASPMVHGCQNASINSIPVELLTDIFEFCQPQSDWTDPLVPTLERIIVVCSHWRTVALAAPYLWSKIALYSPRPIHVSIVRRHLERSKTCPLDLVIRQAMEPEDCESPSEWEDIVAATSMILSDISKHVHRWHSLTLMIYSPAAFPRLVLPTPLLKLVSITGSMLKFDDVQAFWRAILASPAMRSISWSYSIEQKNFLPSLFDCEWGKLIQLAGRFTVDSHLLQILSQCLSLEVLDITDPIDDNTSPATPGTPFVLPSLRVVKFDTAETSLLHHLILPKLQEVVLLRRKETFRPWIDLFDRSQCLLQSVCFKLFSRTDSGEDVAFCLRTHSPTSQIYGSPLPGIVVR
ncbi:hypothetical protein Moror_3244 [Moniliophthora roreri MCA 2997]|uniref:F-box domain-containing protein n=2 Tax=Moniliophthora roreri TaxID=221103 RepID=V2XQE6_MONRO|nr:hypothetical protein Moror_3244 [Moniliophthora roreri MCA 2997]